MVDAQTYSGFIDVLVNRVGIHINETREMFFSLKVDDFNRYIEKMLQTNNHEHFRQLLYYLTLFKDSEHVQELLNNSDLSLVMLEEILLYAHAQAMINGLSEYQALDSVLEFMSQRKYLALLLESTIISKDKMLSYYLITKLDRSSLDYFFNNHPDINSFLIGFVKLPDHIIKMILSRNPDLFGYISLFLQTSNSDYAEEFINKHRIDISEIEELSKIKEFISSKYRLENEKEKMLAHRDMKRISEIVSFLKGKVRVDNEWLISSFLHEGIIVDSVEKNLISEILFNPFFRDVLVKYTAC